MTRAAVKMFSPPLDLIVLIILTSDVISSTCPIEEMHEGHIRNI